VVAGAAVQSVATRVPQQTHDVAPGHSARTRGRE
jgi:hypothetical protein